MTCNLLSSFFRIKQRLFSSMDEAKTPDAHHAATAEGVAAVTVGDGHIRAFALADEPVDAVGLDVIDRVKGDLGHMCAFSFARHNELVEKFLSNRFVREVDVHGKRVARALEGLGLELSILRGVDSFALIRETRKVINSLSK